MMQADCANANCENMSIYLMVYFYVPNNKNAEQKKAKTFVKKTHANIFFCYFNGVEYGYQMLLLFITDDDNDFSEQ